MCYQSMIYFYGVQRVTWIVHSHGQSQKSQIVLVKVIICVDKHGIDSELLCFCFSLEYSEADFSIEMDTS